MQFYYGHFCMWGQGLTKPVLQSLLGRLTPEVLPVLIQTVSSWLVV